MGTKLQKSPIIIFVRLFRFVVYIIIREICGTISIYRNSPSFLLNKIDYCHFACSLIS